MAEQLISPVALVEGSGPIFITNPQLLELLKNINAKEKFTDVTFMSPAILLKLANKHGDHALRRTLAGELGVSSNNTLV